MTTTEQPTLEETLDKGLLSFANALAARLNSQLHPRHPFEVRTSHSWDYGDYDDNGTIYCDKKVMIVEPRRFWFDKSIVDFSYISPRPIGACTRPAVYVHPNPQVEEIVGDYICSIPSSFPFDRTLHIYIH